MSSDWQIVGRQSSVALDVVTAGHGPITFRIENVETGECRDVVAWDEEDLGSQIASGDFDDE